MKIENEFYETTDLCLATTLQVLYEPPQGLLPISPQKVYFQFKNSPKLMPLITKYWHGELAVEPLRFFNELSNLKTRLHENLALTEQNKEGI